MLQGNIQIGQNLFVAGHRIDQLVGHVARISIHQAYPGNIGRRANNFIEELTQPILQTQIMTVVGRILSNEDDLLNASGLQPDHFLDNGRQGAADVGAFDLGNGAKGARAAAAIGNLEVSADPLDRCTQHIALIFTHCCSLIRQVVKGRRMFAAAKLANEGHNIHPASGTDNAIHTRYLLHDSRAVPLRKAAGSNEQLVRPLGRCQLAQCLQRLLLGGINEAAGVND